MTICIWAVVDCKKAQNDEEFSSVLVQVETSLLSRKKLVLVPARLPLSRTCITRLTNRKHLQQLTLFEACLKAGPGAPKSIRTQLRLMVEAISSGILKYYHA